MEVERNRNYNLPQMSRAAWTREAVYATHSLQHTTPNIITNFLASSTFTTIDIIVAPPSRATTQRITARKDLPVKIKNRKRMDGFSIMHTYNTRSWRPPMPDHLHLNFLLSFCIDIVLRAREEGIHLGSPCR